MADLSEKDSSQSVKLVGSSSAGVESNYVEVLNTIPASSSYGIATREVEQQKATYVVAGFVSPGSGPTDVITLIGSDTKKVKVCFINLNGTLTSEGHRDVYVIKRSTINTGGTSTTPTPVPMDSGDVAATAVVSVYTANPTSLGTGVGNVYAHKLFFADATKPSALEDLEFSASHDYVKEITLNSSSESVSINFNGITSAGLSISYVVRWTEE